MFIMSMTNRTGSYLMSVMISLYQKHLCIKTLRILAIEVYKSLMKINLDFMWDFYTIKPIPYDLRTGEKLHSPAINTTRFGLNSLIFRRILLWNNIPTSIKISQGLADFKNNLKHFGKIYCTCAVCSVPLIICQLVDFGSGISQYHNLFLYIDFLLDCICLFKLVFKL